MAGNKVVAKPGPSVNTGVAALYLSIRQVLEQARTSAYRAVNFAMVQAYWQVGRLIVEHEQKGKARAEYGEALIPELAERLTKDFGRGFDGRNLWYMRSFYLAFPILNAPRSELPASTRRAAVRRESAASDSAPTLRPRVVLDPLSSAPGRGGRQGPGMGTCGKPPSSTGPRASSTGRSRCCTTNGCSPAARRRRSGRKPGTSSSLWRLSSSSATPTCSSSST